MNTERDLYYSPQDDDYLWAQLFKDPEYHLWLDRLEVEARKERECRNFE